MLGIYRPPCQDENYYFISVADSLDVYNFTYDKFLLAGDFNAEENEITVSTFLGSYGLKSLLKENTCFKSLRKPRCLDLFITNCKNSFHSTTVISTGLTDFLKLVVTFYENYFHKKKAPGD